RPTMNGRGALENFHKSRLLCRSPTCTRAGAQFVLNILFQRDSVVVLSIVRAIEQCYRASPGGGADRSPGVRSPIQFGKVPASKLRPFLRIMTEPFPQFGTGSGILQPTVDVQRLLFYPSRPKSLDEVAHSVVGSFVFVHPFELNHGLMPPSGNPAIHARLGLRPPNIRPVRVRPGANESRSALHKASTDPRGA